MSLWDRLLSNLGLRHSRRLVFRAEQELIESLESLAQEEQRPTEQLVSDLLAQAVARRQAVEQHMAHWEQLSPREQQVAALVCLNYTNSQIALRLGISQETVKTHVRNLLVKFDLRSRSELRRALGDWDFNGWE